LFGGFPKLEKVKGVFGIGPYVMMDRQMYGKPL